MITVEELITDLAENENYGFGKTALENIQDAGMESGVAFRDKVQEYAPYQQVFIDAFRKALCRIEESLK